MSVTQFDLRGVGPPHAPSGAAAAVAHSAASGAGQLGRRILALMCRAMWEYRVRRAARELAQLDDRMLRDIGVSRSDIDSVVRNGMWRECKGGLFGCEPIVRP